MFKTLLLYSILVSNVFAININPILIADKVNGTLELYNPKTNQQIVITAALYGKTKSDKYDEAVYDGKKRKNNITPAGYYTIRQAFSNHYNRPMLIFITGEKRIMTIHPVYLGSKVQKRQERLDSITAVDNRITGGCINVPTAFYYEHLDKLPNGTILHIKHEIELI